MGQGAAGEGLLNSCGQRGPVAPGGGTSQDVRADTGSVNDNNYDHEISRIAKSSADKLFKKSVIAPPMARSLI